MKHENQLAFVRDKLGAIPPSEWTRVAADANTTVRTFYNVIDPARAPRYDTVFRIYCALKERGARPGARR